MLYERSEFACDRINRFRPRAFKGTVGQAVFSVFARLFFIEGCVDGVELAHHLTCVRYAHAE